MKNLYLIVLFNWLVDDFQKRGWTKSYLFLLNNSMNFTNMFLNQMDSFDFSNPISNNQIYYKLPQFFSTLKQLT